MSKTEKMIERLLRKPKDFTFGEAESLLSKLGYELYNKGKTSGSRVLFKHKDKERYSNIRIHKPHPGNILKRYVLDNIIDELQKQKLL